MHPLPKENFPKSAPECLVQSDKNKSSVEISLFYINLLENVCKAVSTSIFSICISETFTTISEIGDDGTPESSSMS